MNKVRLSLVIGCLLSLALPAVVVPPAHADDDDAMTPAAEWQLASQAWNKREYGDAASMMMTYADANPDEDHTLEAWYNAYETFRSYRPDPARRKEVFDKATEADSKWARKYADSNKERASAGLWYEAIEDNEEGQRVQAVQLLEDLVKKFPGCTLEPSADWTLGEWLREVGHWRDAVTYYQGYSNVVGITEQGAMAVYRIGWCEEALGNKEAAVAAYKQILDNNYNWYWYQVPANAVDAARRLKALKEDELSRMFALRVIDKAHPSWTDLIAQAKTLLGEAPAKKIWLYQYLNYNYDTERQDVTGGTKLTLVKDMPLLFRMSYVSKDSPFKGTLTMSPKVAMDKNAANMTANGKSYSTDIVAPDANGNVAGDTWYGFTGTPSQVTPPDDIVVTRKWTDQGKGWGECAIRVQTTGRYWVLIYLPNDKTNVNNISGQQPNEVRDAGKSFAWYPWYDISQGMNIKFPVQVGGGVNTFCPKVVLQRDTGGRYPDKSGIGTVLDDETTEMTYKLASDTQFPYTISFPGTTTITLEQVME